MLHKVSIAGLTIDPTSNTPIIILQSEDGEQVVPIWIGLLEATSIAAVLQNIHFDRPMTHDLLKSFLDLLEIKVVKIEVNDLRDNTYFAKIYCSSEEKTFSMDARPSDAIAIALRFEAPVYVDDKVIEKSQATDGKSVMLDKSSEGEKWAEYLEKLSPEDFGKYKV
ncbi:MAG: bifunctional nuclease family protein [Desulfobacterales bacterium]|nr:bifunctional nuclease family protein [Desulfobacterales bacterium]